MDLGRLLHPRSVAVVGATERPAAYGSEALLNLARLGFGGAVHAVNPGRDAVHGIPCVPSLSALGEPPDAVVVAVPAPEVPAVVAEAGATGCGGAVVFAAGFAEARDGAALQAALAAAAREHALPVCGPNGNGIVALHARAALWGDMVAPLPAGPVALVSASGNLAVNALASRRGLRLHTVVSFGNGAVVGAEGWLAALAAQDGVGAVALYLEGAGDGAAWCAALETCARRGIGVAVLKGGASEAGAAAALAHTGALAGDQRAFRALVEECGGAWARDPHELLELAKALAAAGRRRGGVPGTAVMTCSGGDASVAADLAEQAGVPLAPLAPATTASLAGVLPAAAAAQNPLDYTSLLWDDPQAIEALVGMLAGDPGVGRVLVLFDEPAGLEGAAAVEWAAVRTAVTVGAAGAPVPVLLASTLPELLPDAAAAALAATGLAPVAGLEAGVRCAAALAGPAGDPERIAAIRVAAARARGDAAVWLAEHEAKALLADAGLPVADGRVVRDADEAVAALADLGGPIALKLSARGLRHKSQVGGLRLGLADAGDVRDGVDDLRAIADGTAVLLAERMAQPGVELLVAARADTVVPVLVAGLGGVWTEALRDVAVIPLPADAERVERALRGLRGAPLLARADVAAAARLAAAAGELLLDRGLGLLELNPVIVHPRGVTVVDALATTTKGTP